jgi:hypothetical protein
MLFSQENLKIYKVGSRHSINLPSSLVTDSGFPFKPNETLTARIDKNRLVLSKG